MGLWVRSKNLLEFPLTKWSEGYVHTTKNLTFTVGKNGLMSLGGETDGSYLCYSFFNGEAASKITEGKYTFSIYLADGQVFTDNYLTFEIVVNKPDGTNGWKTNKRSVPGESSISVSFELLEGETLNRIVIVYDSRGEITQPTYSFNVMLNTGDEILLFQPYGAYPIKILYKDSSGIKARNVLKGKTKNLANIPTIHTINGVHTSTIYLKAGDYTMSVEEMANEAPNAPAIVLLAIVGGESKQFPLTNGVYSKTFENIPEANYSLYMYSNGYDYKGSQGHSATITGFMITKGKEKLPYEPYSEIGSFIKY